MRFRRIGDDVVDFDLPRGDCFEATLDRHHLRQPSEIEKRLHGLADNKFLIRTTEAFRSVEAGPVEHGVKDPSDADGSVGCSRRDVRAEEQQRDMHRGLIEKISVLRFAMLAEALAMIADDDDRFGAGDSLFERRDESPHLLIHRCDLAEVGLLREASAEGLRRLVGIMRIVVVNPEKQRL